MARGAKYNVRQGNLRIHLMSLIRDTPLSASVLAQQITQVVYILQTNATTFLNALQLSLPCAFFGFISSSIQIT